MKTKKFKIVIFSLLFILFTFILTACKKTVDLSFNPNGGLINGSTEVYKVKATKNALFNNPPQATKDGFDFVAWKDSSSQNVDFTNFKATQNQEFTAEWKTKETPKPVEETFKVTIAKELELLTSGIDLTKVKKDTVLTFKVNVPSDKELKKVLVNDQEVIVDSEHKFSTTITKETTIKVELQDKVVPTETFEVTIPAEIQLLTAGIDLTKVVKNTELTFKVNVPLNKKIKDLKVNGEPRAVDTNKEFKVTVVANTTISVEFEDESIPTPKYSVTLPGEIVCLDSSVDLTQVERNTELTFKVNVPVNKKIKELKVNGIDVATNALNEFSVVVTQNTVITVSFENDPVVDEQKNALTQEFEEIELHLMGGKLEIPNTYSEINEANIKSAVSNWVNGDIAEVSVVKKDDKYEITLTHKDNNTVKEARVYEVVIAKKHLTLTLPSNVQLLSPSLALTEIPEGTTVTLKVSVPQDKEIKALYTNSTPVDLSQITATNEYSFVMNENTTIGVEFQYKASVINELNNELNKVLDPLELVIPSGIIEAEDVKNHIKTLIDESKYNLEVAKVSNNAFNVKLINKEHDDLFKEKQIVVNVAKVLVTINYTPYKYNGEETYTFNINKGATLKAEDLPKDDDPKLEIPAGQEFKEYQLDGSLFTEAVLNDNTTLTAIYQATIKHRITFRVEGDEILEPDKYNKVYKVNPNTVFSVPFDHSPIKPGYKFIRWVSNGATHNFTKPITGDVVITAEFSSATYFKYEEINDGYAISGLLDASVVNLYVPKKHDGKNVYSILRGAFANNNAIKKLYISNDGEFKEIGSAAFLNTTGLTEVSLGNTITTVGEFAFAGSKITSIVIPESLTVMGYKAFGASTLKTVTFISTDNDNISKMPFEDSDWVVKASQNAQHMNIVNGTLISVDINNATNLTIPSNVKRIGEGAFYNLNIKSITFSEGLEHIGNEAFAKAQFNENTKLVLPKSLRTVGYRAFAFAKNLKEVEFPADSELRYIRAEAFRKISKLTDVTLGDKLETIGQRAFYQSNMLTNVNEPISVKTVGYEAFMDTTYRQNKVNTHIKKLFVYNKILVDTYSFVGTDLELTNDINSIAERAIYRPKDLQSLTIPDTVKLIKKHALYHFGGLRKIVLSGGVETIEEDAFILQGYYINAGKEAVHQLTFEIQDVASEPAGWHSNWKREQVTADNSPLFTEAGLAFNKVITYKWGQVLTVKYDLDGGEATGLNKKDFYPIGATPTEPNIYPTKDGHTFIGWYLENEHYLFDKPLNESITLKAKYVANNPDYELRYENKELIFVRLLNNTIQEFNVPNKVENSNVCQIAKDAFKGNTTLTKVVIGQNIHTIGDEAFSGNTQLANITIPNNVVNFGSLVFKDTPWLLNKRNTDRYVVVNGVLIDAINIEQIANLPASITKIAPDAFNGNDVTTKVVVNNGVVEIGSYAFRNASVLTEIILPSSLKNGIVRANAFAIGGGNNVTIDASQVHFTKPNTWEDNYDFGDGANLIFKWDESVSTFKLTLSDGISLEDPSLNPNKIAENTEVTFLLAQKEHYHFKKLTVDGEDKTSAISDNKYKQIITQNTTLTLEYEIDDEIKNEVSAELNKLGTKIGYELKDNNRKDSIIAHLGLFLNQSNVRIELTSDDKVRLYSTKAVDYYQETEVINFVRVFALNGTSDIDASAAQASHETNYNEAARYAFDGEEYTKWCDNSGHQPKWITGKLASNMFVSKFKIVHAEINESASMNTREFKLYVSSSTSGEDWEEVADVKNLNSMYSEHAFSGKEIRRVKMEITKAEQAGNVARIYEIYVYGEKETVKLTFDLNGGSYNGSTENIVIDHKKNTNILSTDMPNAVKQYYEIEKWLYNGNPVDFSENINEPRTYTIKWKISSTILDTLEGELNKLPAKVYVTKNSGELTDEDIINHLNTYIDPTATVLGVQKVDGFENKYRVIARFKEDNSVFATREIEIFKKLSTDRNTITFNLKGGNVSGSTTNVIKEFEKGYVLKAEDIAEVLKEYYDFISWLTADNKFVNLVGHILDSNIEVSAKWHINSELSQEVSNELNKIPNIIGIQKEEDLTLEDVSNYLNMSIDNTKVSVNAIADGDNYKVSVTSNKTDYSITKIIAARRLVEITLPDCLELVDVVGNVAMIGEFVQLKASANPAHVIKNIMINGREHFLDSNNLITFKVEGTTTVTAEHEFDKDLAMNHLHRVLSKVPNSVSDENPAILTKDDIEEKLVDVDFEGLDVSIEKYGYDWKITLTNLEDNRYSVSKKIEIDTKKKVNKGVVSYYYAAWYPEDGSSAPEDGSAYGNAFSDSGVCDFTKAFTSTESSTSIITDGRQHINCQINVSPHTARKYVLRIYHAGAMAGGDPQKNTKEFDVMIAKNKFAYQISQYTKIHSETNNTANYTDVTVDLDALGIQTGTELAVCIAVKQGTQTGEKRITIVGAELFEGSKTHNVDFKLNGAKYNNQTNLWQFKIVKGQTLPENSVPVADLANHTFKGYRYNGEVIDLATLLTKTIDADTVIELVFERSETPAQHNVVFKYDGGASATPGEEQKTIQVYENEFIKFEDIPALTKEHYVFSHWENVNNPGQVFDLTQAITEEIELKAVYKVNPLYLQDLNNNFNLIHQTLYVESASDTPSIDEIKAVINNKLVNKNLVVGLELEAGNKYKFSLTHNLLNTLTKEKVISTYKKTLGELDVVLTYNDDMVQEQTIKVNQGELIDVSKLQAFAKEGYQFIGWQDIETNEIIDINNFQVSKATNLRALYKIDNDTLQKFNAILNNFTEMGFDKEEATAHDVKDEIENNLQRTLGATLANKLKVEVVQDGTERFKVVIKFLHNDFNQVINLTKWVNTYKN